MSLYYQIDITRLPYGFGEAHVLFVDDGPFGKDDLFTITCQCNNERNMGPLDAEGVAFIPNTTRHNTLDGKYGPWYAMHVEMERTELYSAPKDMRRAASYIKKIHTAIKTVEDEHREHPINDSLELLVLALRRIKAIPVKYLANGFEEVA